MPRQGPESVTHLQPTIVFTIYIAGERADAMRCCRDFCFEVGLCVSVTDCDFVYTGGAEDGVSVGLVNYPRFPTELETLRTTATKLANALMIALSQLSVLIVGPDVTVWITRREQEAA